jgi:hypothetical protein
VLEASQGDRISGKISRKEVAAVAAAALGTAASVSESPVSSKVPRHGRAAYLAAGLGGA